MNRKLNIVTLYKQVERGLGVWSWPNPGAGTKEWSMFHYSNQQQTISQLVTETKNLNI